MWAVAACVAVVTAVPLVAHEVRGAAGPSAISLPGYPRSACLACGGQLSHGGTPLSVGGPWSKSSQTPTGAPSLSVGAPASIGSKIEQVGTLELTLHGRGVASAVGALSSLAIGEGGFVQSINEHVGGAGAGAYSTGVVVIEVPATRFATALSKVGAIGHVSSLQTGASNVTGQYVDYEAHLSALQSTRASYLAILARASTIPEILQVQQQVDAIQTEIDQLEGQIALLNHETAYSTLTVDMHVAGQPSSPAAASQSGLVGAIHGSIGGFVTGVEWLIRVIGPLLFAVVLLGGLALLARVIWRRRLP
jgi:hypothetical protein